MRPARFLPAARDEFANALRINVKRRRLGVA